MKEKIELLFSDLQDLTGKLANAIAIEKTVIDDQKTILSSISYLLDDLYMEMEKKYDSNSPAIAAIEQCECAVGQINPTLLTKDQKEAVVFALRKLASGPANQTACDEIELSFLRANLEVPTFSSQLFEL